MRDRTRPQLQTLNESHCEGNPNDISHREGAGKAEPDTRTFATGNFWIRLQAHRSEISRNLRGADDILVLRKLADENREVDAGLRPGRESD